MVREFEPKAKGKEVRLEVALFQTTLSADAVLLRRLLENLLDNALRYSPSRSSVSLLVSPRLNHTELRVVDQGPGVPRELRQKVFEAFAQADAGESEGRGLGLAFCRLAVQAHGGRIWIEDGAPGAMVCVALPRPSFTESGLYPSYEPDQESQS